MTLLLRGVIQLLEWIKTLFINTATIWLTVIYMKSHKGSFDDFMDKILLFFDNLKEVKFFSKVYKKFWTPYPLILVHLVIE